MRSDRLFRFELHRIIAHRSPVQILPPRTKILLAVTPDMLERLQRVLAVKAMRANGFARVTGDDSIVPLERRRNKTA